METVAQRRRCWGWRALSCWLCRSSTTRLMSMALVLPVRLSPIDLLDEKERLVVELRDWPAHEARLFGESCGREQLSDVVRSAVKPREEDIVAKRAEAATDVATSLPGLERDKRNAAGP